MQGKQLIRCWISKRYSISVHHRGAMKCLCKEFWEDWPCYNCNVLYSFVLYLDINIYYIQAWYFSEICNLWHPPNIEMIYRLPLCSLQPDVNIKPVALGYNREYNISQIRIPLQQQHVTLTHWGRDKMAAISQTTLSSTFSWKKMSEFRLKFHWSLFLGVQLTIFQHCFR